MLLLVAVTALAGLTSCSGPDPTTVDAGAGSVRVGTQGELRVRVGEAGASIGKWWFLTGEPDPAVLEELGTHVEGCEDTSGAATGCSGTLIWTFRPVAPGTTSLTFQYCWRSSPDDCHGRGGAPAPDPVRLRVTVTDG